MKNPTMKNRLKLASRTIAASLAIAASLISSSKAAGQSCSVEENLLVSSPPPLANNDKFANAVSIDGDFAFIGAAGEDAAANNAGAVYVYRRVNGVWSLFQTLFAPDIAASDGFGTTVLVAGDEAFIGSPGHDPAGQSNRGAVYPYAFNGTSWIAQGELIASDQANCRSFGAAIARSGDTLLIGAPGDIQQGNSASGAAYVLHKSGGTWVAAQKLLASDGAPLHQFGLSVAIDGETAIIGSQDSGLFHATAYVFTFNGASWNERQKMLSPAAPVDEDFSLVMALEADTAIIGAPEHAEAGHSAGAAYVYVRAPGEDFQLSQTLLDSTPDANDTSFGKSVAIRGEWLIVGAPLQTQHYPGASSSAAAGAGYVFRRDRGGRWSEHHQLRRLYHEHDVSQPPAQIDLLGDAAAFSADTVLLGAPNAKVGSTFAAGIALFFDLFPPDCDSNGVPDVCDLDCNHNLVNDACEIAAGSGGDCDMDGVPDECQAGFDYLLDDGSAEFAAGTDATPVDYLWLNQFSVTPGHGRITHIAVPWSGYTPENMPATVLVYSDPNQDGNPADAKLLVSMPASALSVFGITPLPIFTLYALPPVTVGDVGDSFFIGVFMSLPANTYAAALDYTDHKPDRSWRVTAPIGTLDLDDLGAGTTIVQQEGKWVLRAIAMDCNGDGVWDQCDIDRGSSADANADGVPDECENLCAADIDRSGAVDIDDLFMVINAWGACPDCPADLDGNGTVDVDDLFDVINAWGACP